MATQTQPRRRVTAPQPQPASTEPDRTNPTTPDVVDEPQAPASDVTVSVPHAYTLTLDNGGVAHYKPGMQEMPVEHAEHWFSKAQGVTVYVKAEPGEGE